MLAVIRGLLVVSALEIANTRGLSFGLAAVIAHVGVFVGGSSGCVARAEPS